MIRKLTKRFSRQTLSEVKPAPLSETVDHTVEPHLQTTYQLSSPSSSPFPPPSSDDGSEEEEEEEEGEERMDVKSRRRQSLRRKSIREEVAVERVPSAEKRKYSQFKCSLDECGSGSSSDDEVKEAFENSWDDHTPWSQRPIRVPPSGCRKRVPKYFAQDSSTRGIERPRLDFNKMQSKRFLMHVHKPTVLRHQHTYHHPFPVLCPSLELSLDFSSHSFQPVPTHT